MKKPRPPKKGAPEWMTSWADFVSVLMCFFVLLFSLSNMDEARAAEFAEVMRGRNILTGGGRGQVFDGGSGVLPEHTPPVQQIRTVPTEPAEPQEYETHSQMNELAGSFRTYMAPYHSAVLETLGISVDELGEYVRITFEDGMFFDTGQAALRAEAIEVIDYVAAFLARYPGHRISIQGHTDNRPINTVRFPNNLHLSAGRAISVKEHMVNFHGFDPLMLEAVGMGEYRPVATNDTAEGRARNRRVEILVFAQQAGG